MFQNRIDQLMYIIAKHLPDRLRYWTIIITSAQCDNYNPHYAELAMVTHKRALAKAQRKLDNG